MEQDVLVRQSTEHDGGVLSCHSTVRPIVHWIVHVGEQPFLDEQVPLPVVLLEAGRHPPRLVKVTVTESQQLCGKVVPQMEKAVENEEEQYDAKHKDCGQIGEDLLRIERLVAGGGVVVDQNATNGQVNEQHHHHELDGVRYDEPPANRLGSVKVKVSHEHTHTFQWEHLTLDNCLGISKLVRTKSIGIGRRWDGRLQNVHQRQRDPSRWSEAIGGNGFCLSSIDSFPHNTNAISSTFDT